MIQSEIQITTPQLSELKFLRPLVTTALETVDQTYIQNTKIPCWLLPSSGKEIAITPLYYHSAFEAYANHTVSYTPSAEIQVPRGKNKGRLDLALTGKKHIELIELKASRVSLLSKNSTIINKIKQKKAAAKAQFKSMDRKKMEASTKLDIRDSVIVTTYLLAPEDIAFDADKVTKRISEIMNQIKNSCLFTLRASLRYSAPHQINLDSSKNKGEYAVGMIVVACRTDAFK